MSEPERPVEPTGEDFSIVLGGPIYQAYRKFHLAGTGLELLKRRLVGIPLFVWLPVVVLALFEGHAFGSSKALLYDIDVHGRCLVAIPLLIVAEWVVHRRLRGTVRQFTTRNLIAPQDMRAYEGIMASAMRLRNSVVAEVVQVVLAYAVHWMWGSKVCSSTAPGGARPRAASGTTPRPAAWYAFVTLPVFRVLLFRWYWRLFIWYRFLWQVRGLNLQLDALHPDRSAGLGFLANMPAIFTPLLLAHSAMVAAVIQNKIWNTGAKLEDFYVELGGVVVFLAIISFTPLFFFGPKLALAKRKAGADYGALASRYVGEFREKWLAGARLDRRVIGSGDIQSLADLSGAYQAIRETRFVPITRQSFVQLIVIAGLPLLPLALNLMRWEELLHARARVLVLGAGAQSVSCRSSTGCLAVRRAGEAESPGPSAGPAAFVDAYAPKSGGLARHGLRSI